MQTPAQVARKANVTAQSIRNYTRDYGELLSDSARGENGPRLYTDEDVSVLCLIADLRKSGVPPSEVAARVRSGDAPTIIDVIDVPANEAKNSLKTGVDGALAVQTVLSTLNGRFEGIERRLETRDRQAALWQIGTGIWIGMLLMGGIFFVTWLVVNGGL